MKYYFIYTENKKTTIGLAINNKLRFLDTYSNNILRDDIFIAKVIKEISSINGYIIEIEKDVKGCIEKRFLPEDLKLGDEILVQLYKKTSSDKLDKFTTDYSISGKNLIYYPNKEKNIFSKKIKNKIKDKFIKNNDLSVFKGVTFRTKSLKYDIEVLKKEYNSLKELNNFIVKQSKFLPIPRKVYSNIKFVYENIDDEFDYIITNDKDKYNSFKNYFINNKIIYDENYNFKYDDNISNDLINLSAEKVEISKNVNIVIEKTEALTVVDVNSNNDESFLVVNKEAVTESLRQVELRDIKGIILIDVITVSKKEMEELNSFVEDESKKYSKVEFKGISNTGLLEFIRTGINIDN